MRTLTFLLVPLFVSACGEAGEGDEGGGGLPDDTATACNEANESCDAPGTCGGEGANMLPGSPCLSCHTTGGGEAGVFGAGGTIFEDLDGTAGAEGVIVRVTDSTGKVVEMTSTSSGNFYTKEDLVPPISAEAERDGNVVQMVTQPDTANCNTCHKCDGAAGGKLYAP